MAPTWIAPGQPVVVAGLTLDAGLFYLGSPSPSAHDLNYEPSLIDPALPVQLQATSDGGALQWPIRCYSQLTPAERGAYVQWLATGRRSPIGPTATLLFLCGLERRLLRDGEETGDASAVAAELQRLLETQENDEWFSPYARELLDVIAPIGQAVPQSGGQANVALRKGLGMMSAAQTPIPADWALAWVESSDNFYPRTPALRCAAEFSALFRIRYEQEFGSGLLVKPNKTVVKCAYRPANSSLPGQLNFEWSLPDVTVLKQPIGRLLTLAATVQDELDPYSRFIGRQPDQVESPAALSLLPSALFAARAGALSPLLDLLERRISGQDSVAIEYADLRQAWPQLPGNPGKRDSINLAKCLQQVGYGLEPDVRFGVHPIDSRQPVVLFRQIDGPSAPSSEYANATVFAHLGAVLARADGHVSAAEEAWLLDYAAHRLNLNGHEIQRLQAYMKWLFLAPRELSGLKKRLDALPSAARAGLGSFLAKLADADGTIAPEEVTLVGKIYRLLGLDPAQAFEDIHTAATEPVRITVDAAAGSPGFSISPPPNAVSPPSVDTAKIRLMQAESDRVATLLRGIFAEDDPPISVPAQRAVVTLLHGLDPPHSSLLTILVSRAEWSREAMSDAAAGLGLLPDGAIDTINEMALDRAGELLLEGDDPLSINHAVKEELSL
jgi:uncharacterized tellurite resistance protein B-like protein